MAEKMQSRIKDLNNTVDDIEVRLAEFGEAAKDRRDEIMRDVDRNRQRIEAGIRDIRTKMGEAVKPKK